MSGLPPPLPPFPAGSLQHLQIWLRDFIKTIAWEYIYNTYLSHMSYFIKISIVPQYASCEWHVFYAPRICSIQITILSSP